MKHQAGGGAIYGLGVIGAWVYYITHTTTFVGVVVGIVKALFWPAVILYKVLELLQM